MILEEILQSSSSWNAIGIPCPNYETFRRYHRFLREAILDRHIPHHRAIGVSFMHSTTSLKHFRNVVNIEGNNDVGESYPELMLNLQDKVFLPKQLPNREVFTVRVAVNTGENVVSKLRFAEHINSSDEDNVQVLCTNPKVCNVMNDQIILEIHTYYGCGFMDMSQTSKLLSPVQFPFYVDYSLQDYVRVLPPARGNQNVVQLRFLNGMTKEKFIMILARWNQAIKTINFGNKEKLWLQNSEH